MTVTDVRKDPEHADHDRHRPSSTHPVDRVWQLWADPRQLERWWGPPEYPATFDGTSSSPVGPSPTS